MSVCYVYIYRYRYRYIIIYNIYDIYIIYIYLCYIYMIYNIYIYIDIYINMVIIKQSFPIMLLILPGNHGTKGRNDILHNVSAFAFF